MGCSSALSPSLPFLSTSYHPVLRPCYIFSFINSSTPFLKFSNIKQRVVSLSASVVDKELQVSWLTPETNKDEDYGGWAVVEAEKKNKKKKGFLSFLLMGAGVSAVILIAVIAYRLIVHLQGKLTIKVEALSRAPLLRRLQITLLKKKLKLVLQSQ